MTAQTASPLRPALQNRLHDMRACTDCGVCVRECAFLQKHGTPGRLAAAVGAGEGAALAPAFACALCGLCAAVCPEGIDPGALFLEMRREAVDRGEGDFPAHRPLLNYERQGASLRFSLYRLPPGCTTVFFPGCSLCGTRPGSVRTIFSLLRRLDAATGIVLDCCLKPSHSLGREAEVAERFARLRARLVERGVRTVLVACPNCQSMFSSLGEGLQVRTVWEVLAEADLPLGEPSTGTVTVHDPCVIRQAAPAQQAVRTLLRRQGLAVEEMPHSGRMTLCCGKGGGVDLLHPELARQWREVRREEAGERRIVSYCAGCVQALGGNSPASHLTDILFSAPKAMAGKVKGAPAPLTYLNRLRLKREFATMETDFAADDQATLPEKKKRSLAPVALLALVATAVAIRLAGLDQALQPEKLRATIEGYGGLAPVVYILLYTLAPVFFLPALPLTILGGLLFGPVWGVVYTITGATLGASLAFLVARYLARDWVAAKLDGPRWERLDREVAAHGWKVVAFTRLIPAFPFNLLNYALGLTKIPFLHYVVASFVCMLPACIAYIVFSSSLLDLLRGNLSPAALVGIALIVLVSLLPVAYRRFRKGRQESSPPQSPS